MVHPPDPAVPADWAPVDPFPELRQQRSFVSDDGTSDRLRVVYYRRGDEPVLRGRAWFGPGAEGPPGHAHGGSVAAVLDEALGAAAWMLGHRVVVARLTADFRGMIPLGTDASLESWVIDVAGRKVRCRARLMDGDRLLAEGEAVCVILTAEQASPFTRHLPR